MREAVAKQQLSHLSPEALHALTDLAESSRSVGFVAIAGQVLREMHRDHISVDASRIRDFKLLKPEAAETEAHWDSWLAAMRRSRFSQISAVGSLRGYLHSTQGKTFAFRY